MDFESLLVKAIDIFLFLTFLKIYYGTTYLSQQT